MPFLNFKRIGQTGLIRPQTVTARGMSQRIRAKGLPHFGHLMRETFVILIPMIPIREPTTDPQFYLCSDYKKVIPALALPQSCLAYHIMIKPHLST